MLDQVRTEDVLIRDEDGSGLVFTTAARWSAAREETEVLERLASLTVQLISARAVVERPIFLAECPEVLGPWVWLRSLATEDIRRFLDEATDALAVSLSERDMTEVESVVSLWRKTSTAS